MIGTESINCISVERFAYLFCQIHQLDINMNFGRLFEQENDAGECQYVYEIYQDKLSDELLEWIVLPGIDLTTRETVYVRSLETPYFIECSSPPRYRGDVKYWLNLMKLDYYDAFEFMMRSRAITHHTNCYLGRTATDFFDAWRARNDDAFYRKHSPNLAETPENVFHPAERLFDSVHYSTTVK